MLPVVNANAGKNFNESQKKYKEKKKVIVGNTVKIGVENP